MNERLIRFVVEKKQMETSIRSKSAAGFSPTVCEAILEVLEECADSLTVYQNILRQQSTIDDDATNIFPNVKYVLRIVQ